MLYSIASNLYLGRCELNDRDKLLWNGFALIQK